MQTFSFKYFFKHLVLAHQGCLTLLPLELPLFTVIVVAKHVSQLRECYNFFDKLKKDAPRMLDGAWKATRRCSRDGDGWRQPLAQLLLTYRWLWWLLFCHPVTMDHEDVTSQHKERYVMAWRDRHQVFLHLLIRILEGKRSLSFQYIYFNVAIKLHLCTSLKLIYMIINK